jgi:hypothetical protein
MEYYLKVFYGRPNKSARSVFIRAYFRRKKEGKTNKYGPNNIHGGRGNQFRVVLKSLQEETVFKVIDKARWSH